MFYFVTGNEKVKSVLSDYKDYCTDTTIKFVVTLQKGQLEIMEKEGLHKVFKLQSIVNISSMCAFDEFGCLVRYESVMKVLQDFYTLRMKMYQKRKDYMVGVLEAEAAKLSNQARFIMEKCSGELTVENKKRKTIVDELIKRGYAPDPVKEWKKRIAEEDEDEEEQVEEEESQEDESKKKKKTAPESGRIQILYLESLIIYYKNFRIFHICWRLPIGFCIITRQKLQNLHVIFKLL